MNTNKRRTIRIPMAWFRPGIGLKRWLGLLLAGVIVMAGGASLIWLQNFPLFRDYDKVWAILFLLGWLLAITGIAGFLWQTFRLPAGGGIGTKLTYAELAFHMSVLDRGPNMVAIGGGSGLSSLLRGIKEVSSNITAIVTVADDGGGSGVLRQDLGILPPGDVRNCVIALSRAEPQMEELLQYRFTEGSLKGQSMGNLLLAAMADINGGMVEAVARLGEILAVAGRVLPVSTEDIRLKALLRDGSVVVGESNIGSVQFHSDSNIKKVWLEPADCRPIPEVLEAISHADVIIIGPGSLYTSIIPNLLVPGVAQALREASAPKIYVMNLMTQPGETQGYDAAMHYHALCEHTGDDIVDYLLVNDCYTAPKEMLQRYHEDHSDMVCWEQSEWSGIRAQIVPKHLLKISNNRIRHSYSGLTQAVMEIYKKHKKANRGKMA